MTFDARPLTDPVDARAVSAFQAELRSRESSTVSGANIFGYVVLVLILVVAVPTLVATLASIFSSGGSSRFPQVGVLLFAGIGIVAAVIAVVGWRRARVTRYRLDAFARANGMTYTARTAQPPLPGMIFGLGRSRLATDIVRGRSPRFVEFANYEYTTGSGKNSKTHRWGYVAVRLDVPLPNIVLDAKGNNGFGSNLPAAFQREQRLSLEGDFDRYFTLYCPEGYERDALYLFTPDIMARFIDNAAELDVEIVDDWLFLYTQRKVSTLDPATWAWLFGAVGALLTKFDQWARWRDERLQQEAASGTASAPQPLSTETSGAQLPFAPPAGLLAPPPGVAREGRRLKKGVRWLPILVLIGLAASWFWFRSF